MDKPKKLIDIIILKKNLLMKEYNGLRTDILIDNHQYL